MQPSSFLYEGQVFQGESGESTEPAAKADGKQILKICGKAAAASQAQDKPENKAAKQIRQKGSQWENPAQLEAPSGNCEAQQAAKATA